MKEQIPPEIIDLTERALFLHPAKRFWGKIGRFAFKIVKIFINRKN